MAYADGIYRKVYTSIWGDSKFRTLSRAPPNAKTLWLYLLTGDHTNQIPGLSSAGEGRLSESLGWSIDAFRTTWGEIEAMRMASADWQARVVWLRNAILYNEPANPNVVKGWAKTWATIPECELKERARRDLLRWMRDRGTSFVAAFDRACPAQGSKRNPKRYPEDFEEGSPNQEQQQEEKEEQQQDPHQEQAERLPLGKSLPARETPAPAFDLAEAFRLEFAKRLGRSAASLPWSEAKGEGSADQVKAQVREHLQRMGPGPALLASLEVAQMTRSPLRSMTPLPLFLKNL